MRINASKTLTGLTLFPILTAAVIFGLLQAYSFLTFQQLPSGGVLTDTGVFSEMSRVAAEGGRLYVDMWDLKPPVTYYIGSVFVKLFGNTMLSIRLATLSIATAFIFANSAIAFSVTRSWIAVCVTASLAFTYAMWQASLESFNTVFTMATLTSTGMLCIIAGRGKALPLFAGGIFFAMAFFTKQVVVFEGFAAIAFAYAFANKSNKNKAVWWVTLGGLTGIMCFVIWFAVRGSLVDLWRSSFYNGLLYSFEPEGSGWHFNDEFIGLFQTYFIGDVLPFLLPLLILIVPALIVLVTQKKYRTPIIVALLWLLTAIAGAMIGRSMRLQYFLEVLPPLLLLAAIVTVAFQVRQGWQSFIVVIAVGWAFFQNGVLANPSQTLRQLLDARYVSPDALTAMPETPVSISELVQFLQQRTAPDECLFTWGEVGTVHYLAGIPSCTAAPIEGMLMILGSFDAIPERDRYMQQLLTSKPSLHLQANTWGYFPDLERYVERYRDDQLLSGQQTGNYSVWSLDMSSQHQASAIFNDDFLLTHYDLITDGEICAGESLQVATIYSMKTPPKANYNIFFKLLTTDQSMSIADAEGLPNDNRSTLDWDFPQTIYLSNIFEMQITEDAAPGNYLLVHGFYETDTYTRIPVADANGNPQKAGYVILGNVEVSDCDTSE